MSVNKYLDNNGVLYLWSKIKALFVSKEAGKGLSTNDYTTAEKTKLAEIEEGANNYALPTAGTTTLGGVKIDGTTVTINANGVISASNGASFQRVTSLPASGASNVIYLLPHSGNSGGNVYDEYVWCDTDGSGTMGWESIGSTAIDLSGYMLTSDMVAITNAEIDNIAAS